MAEQLSPEQADYRARCYVNGVRKHGRTGIMSPHLASSLSASAASVGTRERD